MVTLDFIAYVVKHYGKDWRKRQNPKSACKINPAVDKFGRPIKARRDAAMKNSKVLKDHNI